MTHASEIPARFPRFRPVADRRNLKNLEPESQPPRSSARQESRLLRLELEESRGISHPTRVTRFLVEPWLRVARACAPPWPRRLRTPTLALDVALRAARARTPPQAQLAHLVRAPTLASVAAPRAARARALPRPRRARVPTLSLDAAPSAARARTPPRLRRARAPTLALSRRLAPLALVRRRCLAVRAHQLSRLPGASRRSRSRAVGVCARSCSSPTARALHLLHQRRGGLDAHAARAAARVGISV